MVALSVDDPAFLGFPVGLGAVIRLSFGSRGRSGGAC